MMSQPAPAKVIIAMSDYGHDPTETAIPFSVFKTAGLTVHFATESGVSPRCDSRMLVGVTGLLLGAPGKAKKAYDEMISSTDASPGSINTPLSWTDPKFTLKDYDMVFLPGGHDKAVRQVIESKVMHRHLAEYFPQANRTTGDGKVVAAICHGVQVLSTASSISNPEKSVIHSCKTTALPSFMESSIYQLTRVFLGDYYKTYGAGSPDVEDFVKKRLDDPVKQFAPGPRWWGMGTPMVVEDDKFRYVSARFPPDAELLANRAMEMVNEAKKD